VSADPTNLPASEVREPWPRFEWVVIGGMFLIGFVNFPLQVVGTKLDHVPGFIDNRLNNFVLEHGYRYLTGREASFWDAPSFYPRRGATAWSDAHIGMLPLYSVLRMAGCSPEQGLQGHFLACFVLNYIAAVWALRRLGFRPVGVAAGAFVFTFALPVVGHIIHMQLLPRFLVPPAIVFAWEFLRLPHSRRLAYFAACCVGQLYLTVYIGFMLVLLLAGGLLVTLVRFRAEIPWDELRRPKGREPLKRAAVVLCSAVAIMPLLHHGAEDKGTQTAWIRHAAPRPSSWFMAPNVSRKAPNSVRDFQQGEHELLIGYVPLLAIVGVALLGLRPTRLGTARGAAVASAWTVLLLAVFVTRFGPIWLYEPFVYLPAFERVRVVSRIVMVLLFPAGVAVTWVVDSYVAYFSVGRRRGPALAAIYLALGLVIVDQWLVPVRGHDTEWSVHRDSLAELDAWQARIKEAISRHPQPKVVYVFPTAGYVHHDMAGLQTETMRATQDLGIPCVNGYTGNFPYRWHFFSGYRSLMVWLTEANDTPSDQLAGLVVIGCPVPDADPVYEGLMRIVYPPRFLGNSDGSN